MLREGGCAVAQGTGGFNCRWVRLSAFGIPMKSNRSESVLKGHEHRAKKLQFHPKPKEILRGF